MAQAVLLGPFAVILRYIFDTVIPAGHLQRLALIGGALLLLNPFSNGLQLWLRHVSSGRPKIVGRHAVRLIIANDNSRQTLSRIGR
ncbi:MAG: hypothetical protein Q7S20_11810 [Gemmatimonadaceae bacterium]|nr:hypothetical protein [Gemmatimonadaceae bacterium]